MTSQGMIKEQELIKSELRSELTRKASYTAVNPLLTTNRLRSGTEDRIEAKFLSDLLRVIGADKEKTSYETILKKLKKQHRFT